MEIRYLLSAAFVVAASIVLATAPGRDDTAGTAHDGALTAFLAGERQDDAPRSARGSRADAPAVIADFASTGEASRVAARGTRPEAEPAGPAEMLAFADMPSRSSARGTRPQIPGMPDADATAMNWPVGPESEPSDTGDDTMEIAQR